MTNLVSQPILVTGGAGYVGSHVCKALLEYGYTPVILDDLSTGFEENVPPGVKLVKQDILDLNSLVKLFHVEQFLAVIHCAAKTSVEEGELKPDLYTAVNIQGTMNVCFAALHTGVKAFILSSTAAVYGSGNGVDYFSEKSPVSPENWYGKTKARSEDLVRALSPHIPHAILRYFNVCGASDTHGDRREPKMLLPRMVRCALGKFDQDATFTIHGTDYDTYDGTAVRDLIDIEDLARAHVLALREVLGGYIQDETINLGSGRAYSVKTLAQNVASLYGMEIKPGPRRPGDVAHCAAQVNKARNLLSWAPTKSLLQIIQSEYNWQKSRSSR